MDSNSHTKWNLTFSYVRVTSDNSIPFVVSDPMQQLRSPTMNSDNVSSFRFIAWVIKSSSNPLVSPSNSQSPSNALTSFETRTSESEPLRPADIKVVGHRSALNRALIGTGKLSGLSTGRYKRTESTTLGHCSKLIVTRATDQRTRRERSPSKRSRCRKCLVLTFLLLYSCLRINYTLHAT